MRPYVLCAAALFAVALVVARPSRADDKKPSDDDSKKYTVKPPPTPAKGKSVKVNEKTTVKEASKFGDLNLKKQKQLVHVYVEKTLEEGDKTNTRKKFSREYEK